MDNTQARKLLGVGDTASAQEIQQAVIAKKKQANSLLSKAPTDALKAKYEKMLAQVDSAMNVLTASDVTSRKPNDDARAGFSQSKFEDLPFAKPRHSQFEDQAKAELSIQEGQVLAGRYKIEEKIAAGGMGVVYRAFDQNRSEDIAIKVMLPSLVKNARAKERFLDEARLSSKLSHANIVNVFDVQNDGDFYFLTMELLEGQDLRDVMENRKATRQPYTKDEVLDLLDQITAGLNHAHQSTVHRDLKPENIYLTEEGHYKVMDFGIARVQSTNQRTQSGSVSGTAYYMAPEQLKGAKDIGTAADQYALGVMVYELLSGEVPAGVIKPLHELRPDIGKGFSAAVMQALANAPEERHDSLDAFLQALQTGKNRSGPSVKVDSSKLAMAGVVLVGLLLMVGIFQSGIVDIDGLFVSKEEIAQQKADIAKLQGEIKNYQRRLEAGQRDLKSEVRDAERNKSNKLKNLQHWQRLTDDYIFDGNIFTDLEGQLSMAETLLREESLEEAKTNMAAVRDGYKKVWGEFSAAEHLYQAEEDANTAKAKWQKRKKTYKVSADALETQAQEKENTASQLTRDGEFAQAEPVWKEAETAWGEASQSVTQEVASIEAQWAANRKQKKLQAAERKRQEAERERQALIKLLKGELVNIPSGSFRMGDLSGDGRSNEKPVRTVRISAFEMQAHEVTWAQYQPCIDAGACPSASSDGSGQADRPVNNVNYSDFVNKYIPWLNKTTGLRFRLPSEAEWEYAARAGSTTKYSWGNGIGHNRANCDGCGSAWDNNNTAPVKSFQPNAFGLYDMHGNVAEWVGDCWHKNYQGAPRDGSTWRLGNNHNCLRRMVRGGSFIGYPKNLRSAIRVSEGIISPSGSRLIGFRLVRDL